MSVFHELATASPATQPFTAIGTDLAHIFILIKLLIATFGAFTILVGACIGIYRYIIYRLTHSREESDLNAIRLDLARVIILGLEFFIASDVIETTIAPDFQSLGILGILVVIRTILNFSLHKEIKDLSEISSQKTA